MLRGWDFQGYHFPLPWQRPPTFPGDDRVAMAKHRRECLEGASAGLNKKLSVGLISYSYGLKVARYYKDR